MDRSDRYFPKQLVSLVPNFELLQIPIALQLILRPINIADVLTLWSIVSTVVCFHLTFMRPSNRRVHDPPIGGSICPSVLRSVPWPPLTGKQNTTFKRRGDVTHLRHQFWVQKIKAQGLEVTGGGNVKIVFGPYFHEKCIDSRKTKTSMTLIPCCTFRLIQCSSESA